jgi:DNA repair exonuclease SbcCD nuclease subunit
MTIRFLHAADLHLGMRITRFEESACKRIGEARFAAIENLRAKAVEHKVDFVLIAGDLFDDHSVSFAVSERAFTLFEGKAMPCPVFIIPGNHDPLTPGGVWNREPWMRDQPTKNIHLLREPKQVAVPNMPVTLFPCPLRSRNSIDDPTGWIANHPRKTADRTIRIGLAHGSLRIMPNLPEDDHLIRPDAAEHYGLDYLALGHWHKPLRHRCLDGVERTTYSGTHEPMRFPGVGQGFSTGWSSYSADGDAERFQDAGRGAAHLVRIDEAGAPPHIETIEIGKLRWLAEHRDVTTRPLGEIISEFGAEKQDQELTVLRLTLSGVLNPAQYGRIDSILREIVCNRYGPGSSLDAEDVLVEPNPEQLGKIVGDGVLARVLARLQVDAGSSDRSVKRVADHALKLLYRIAWEGQPQ